MDVINTEFMCAAFRLLFCIIIYVPTCIIIYVSTSPVDVCVLVLSVYWFCLFLC